MTTRSLLALALASFTVLSTGMKLPDRRMFFVSAVSTVIIPGMNKAMSPFLSDYVKNDLENERITGQQVIVSSI